MDYFYKHFYSSLATCKFTVYKATSFPVLDKHADDIKYSGQRMADMCLIETSDPQQFSHIWNGLLNGNILEESNDMYPKTISKAYDVIFKYKTLANSTCLPCNFVGISFQHRGCGNQTSPPVAGTNHVLHRYAMCYNCDRPSH